MMMIKSIYRVHYLLITLPGGCSERALKKENTRSLLRRHGNQKAKEKVFEFTRRLFIQYKSIHFSFKKREEYC